MGLRFPQRSLEENYTHTTGFGKKAADFLSSGGNPICPYSLILKIDTVANP